jgi:small subunit ribosomal protein S8
MISNIKVGYIGKQLQVSAGNNKVCVDILGILYRLGYIRGFTVIDRKSITIFLKYNKGKSVIRNINVVSTPGRRFYLQYRKLLNSFPKSDTGSYIISTSRGIISSSEAMMFRIGGEVLVKVN